MECREAPKQPAIAGDKKLPQKQSTEKVSDLLASVISHTQNWLLKNGKAICVKKSQKNAPVQAIHFYTYKHIPRHFNINCLLASWLLLKYHQLRRDIEEIRFLITAFISQSQCLCNQCNTLLFQFILRHYANSKI